MKQNRTVYRAWGWVSCMLCNRRMGLGERYTKHHTTSLTRKRVIPYNACSGCVQITGAMRKVVLVHG